MTFLMIKSDTFLTHATQLLSNSHNSMLYFPQFCQTGPVHNVNQNLIFVEMYTKRKIKFDIEVNKT